MKYKNKGEEKTENTGRVEKDSGGVELENVERTALLSIHC